MNNWKQSLTELSDYPLLPCGAGEKGKAPLDPATGKGLKNWQTASFTPDQILGMNGVVKCVGTRCGPEANNLLILDIDGASARDFLRQHNCSDNPRDAWIIKRSSADDRYKIAFQINDKELEERLEGVGKVVHNTSTSPREQLELFWGAGQCIVLGDHVESGGHYYWEGCSPSDIGPPPQTWRRLILHLLRKEEQRSKAAASTSKGVVVQSGPKDPCPICGRNTSSACTLYIDGERRRANCFIGQTFAPPSDLQEGEVIKRGERSWTYRGEGTNAALGNFSKFVEQVSAINETTNQQGVSPQVGKVQWVVDQFLAKGGFTLVAAEEGAGKTALLLRLSEALSTGALFLGQLETVKSRVLILQADEPEAHTRMKLRRMGIPDGLFEVRYLERFDMRSLRQLIESKQWGVICLDSLTNGLTEQRCGVSDDEFTSRLYKITKWLGNSEVSCVATTHLNKPFNGQPRKTIIKHDIAGLSTIKNAVSDTWGLLKLPGQEETFQLNCLGKRHCPTNTEWTLAGSVEDFSYEITASNTDMPVERQCLRQRILCSLEEVTEETARTPNHLAPLLGSSTEVVRRYCAELFGEGEIERVSIKGTGRPQHAYYLP